MNTGRITAPLCTFTQEKLSGATHHCDTGCASHATAQNTHNGACGAPENTPELSLQPDRIFNLDERLV